MTEPEFFGDTHSYEVAGEWLADCETVADWGCGKGAFSRFVQSPRRYYGFDGSRSPFACQVVDLAEFTFQTEGILLRHVIEHDHRWREILTNAAASFTKRLVVVVFTPMLPDTEDVHRIAEQQMAPGMVVPDLSFSRRAIVDAVGPGLLTTIHAMDSATQYGSETLFKFAR